MSTAEGLFAVADLTHSPQLARQAADDFLVGAGEYVLDDLVAQGYTLDDIEGMDEVTLLELAGEAMARVGERRDKLDPKARKVVVAWAMQTSDDLRG
jgi:hypothetical protein